MQVGFFFLSTFSIFIFEVLKRERTGSEGGEMRGWEEGKDGEGGGRGSVHNRKFVTRPPPHAFPVIPFNEPLERQIHMHSGISNTRTLKW